MLLSSSILIFLHIDPQNKQVYRKKQLRNQEKRGKNIKPNNLPL